MTDSELPASDVPDLAEPTATGDEQPSPAASDPGSEPGGSAPAVATASAADRPAQVGDLEQEGEVAADYLEELLDICDLDGDLDLDVENDRAMVAIVGTGLDNLVGRGGETLDALQELTRLAVQAATGRRSRLMLDIAGYRAQRRVELAALATRTAEQVRDGGESVRLAPMNPFERKIVHDTVATMAGVHSESEGEEPARSVVVLRD
jgi:spoIIIJ-associated protein